jgi:hypothetical protein
MEKVDGPNVHQLKMQVENNHLDLATRLCALHTLSVTSLKKEKAFITQRTVFLSLALEREPTQGADMMLESMIRIYDNLGLVNQRNAQFQRWVIAWGQVIAGANNLIGRLHAGGFMINDLNDLGDCDPIEVLNFTSREFIG